MTSKVQDTRKDTRECIRFCYLFVRRYMRWQICVAILDRLSAGRLRRMTMIGGLKRWRIVRRACHTVSHPRVDKKPNGEEGLADAASVIGRIRNRQSASS